MIDVFIAHSETDKSLAVRLAAELEDCGVSVQCLFDVSRATPLYHGRRGTAMKEAGMVAVPVREASFQDPELSYILGQCVDWGIRPTVVLVGFSRVVAQKIRLRAPFRTHNSFIVQEPHESFPDFVKKHLGKNRQPPRTRLKSPGGKLRTRIVHPTAESFIRAVNRRGPPWREHVYEQDEKGTIYRFTVRSGFFSKRVVLVADDEPEAIRKHFEGKVLVCRVDDFTPALVRNLSIGLEKTVGPLKDAMNELAIAQERRKHQKTEEGRKCESDNRPPMSRELEREVRSSWYWNEPYRSSLTAALQMGQGWSVEDCPQCKKAGRLEVLFETDRILYECNECKYRWEDPIN